MTNTTSDRSSTCYVCDGPEHPTTAAERVRQFLLARSAMGGLDPENIASVGAPGTGDLVPLDTADLEALVRGVLGDVPTRLPRRRARASMLPDGMTWDDVRRREAASHSADDTDGG